MAGERSRNDVGETVLPAILSEPKPSVVGSIAVWTAWFCAWVLDPIRADVLANTVVDDQDDR